MWAWPALWPLAQPCGQRHVATTWGAGFRSPASQRPSLWLRVKRGEADSCLFEVVLSVGIPPQPWGKEENSGNPNSERCVDEGVSYVPAGMKLACCSYASHPPPHLQEGKTKLVLKRSHAIPLFPSFFPFTRALEVQRWENQLLKNSKNKKFRSLLKLMLPLDVNRGTKTRTAWDYHKGWSKHRILVR